MVKLQSPQNVAVTLVTAAGTSTLTVGFHDPNSSGSVATYDVQFLLRSDTSQSVAATGTPFAATAANVTNSSGNVTITGITAASSTPAVTDLQSNYVVSVVAGAAAGSTSFQDSDPGLSTFWEVSGSLYLTIGSLDLTLTADTSSSGSRVYRLPVTPGNPLVITFADVQTFVSAISSQLGAASAITVPSTLPNNSSLLANTSLSLEKLAVDTIKGLFALQVSLTLGGSNGWTPFTGLTIQKLGLSVLRTNGTDQL